MPQKRVRLVPLTLTGDDEGGFVSSVSVASHSALVVISNLTSIDSNTMMAVAIITEDEDE
jgi:hypothetical protein